MAIDKLPEFAKDGQKNTEDLVLTDGFPVLKKPARQWFNWLFNILSLKTNEIIDEVDTKLSKSSNLSDLTSAATARTNLGLGTAATSNVTTSRLDSTLNRLIKVGDYGLGTAGEVLGAGGYNSLNIPAAYYDNLVNLAIINHGNYGAAEYSMLYPKGFVIPNINGHYRLLFSQLGTEIHYVKTTGTANNQQHAIGRIRTSLNTTIDSNGFIKAASPVIQLFSDKIKLNSEADQQSITFEKLGVGDYLIKGSTGLSNDGWYIEQPKDANGSVYHAVVYKQLENGDISVKTFEQKLEGTRIVADVEKPVDIKENRFISIRLNELPQDTTAPENPNIVDGEGNPAPSKYHYLEKGEWKITADNEVILGNERYAAYQASLRPLTRRQFKLALLENGLLDQIENLINAIADDQARVRIQIEYAESTEFHRTSDSVAYMCQLLGLTDEQVDQMWEQALTL